MAKISALNLESQDWPPAVPKLRSGSTPSKKRGTSAAMLCASQSSA